MYAKTCVCKSEDNSVQQVLLSTLICLENNLKHTGYNTTEFQVYIFQKGGRGKIICFSGRNTVPIIVVLFEFL